MLSIILLSCIIGFGSLEIKTKSGQLGSDLHLPVPELCNTSQDVVFDVYSADTRIGSHHGFLQGLNGYQGRLYLCAENCTITLKNLSEADGRSYKIRLGRVDEKGATVFHDVDFNISIIDPEQTSPEMKKQDGSPSRVKLYVSAVLSLVPSVLAFIVGIFRVLIMCGKVYHQLQAITCGLQISWVFTILCQVISLGCWSCHECLGQLIAAILITTVLIGDMLFCFGRVYKHRGYRSECVTITDVQHGKESPDEPRGRAQVHVCECWPRCGESNTLHYKALSPAVNLEDSGTGAQEFWPTFKKKAGKCWLWILLSVQLSFTLLVWVSYSTMDSGTSGEISQSLNYLILPSFLGSFLAIIILPCILVCCYYKHNAFGRNSDSPRDARPPPSGTEPCVETKFIGPDAV